MLCVNFTHQWLPIVLVMRGLLCCSVYGMYFDWPMSELINVSVRLSVWVGEAG